MNDIEIIEDPMLEENKTSKQAASSAGKMTARNGIYVTISVFFVELLEKLLSSIEFMLDTGTKTAMIAGFSSFLVFLWQYLYKRYGKKFLI